MKMGSQPIWRLAEIVRVRPRRLAAALRIE